MAILTKAQLEALNQSSFPDQSTEAITPAILRTYNTATIDTLVDSLDTGSFVTDVSALNAFTASQLSINSGLNASTASQQISINNLNSNTASVDSSITILTAASASFEAKFETIGTQSGSWGSGGSVPAGTVSGSAQIVALGFLQTSSFNSYTSSTNSSISQLNASSASQQISINNLNSTTASINSSITQLNASSASQQISINALNAATSSYATSAITASSLVTASFSGNTLTFTKGDASTFGIVIPDVSGSGIPEGTVSSSAQILNYGIFATTGSNIFIGDQTITGSFSTNGGATIGNTSAQYNSVNIVTSKTNYPGNVYNAFNINTDGDGQWSAGLYVSTYNGFGSEPAAGLYGGGTGNAGSNNILESYGNLVRINKNTQLSGSLEVSASLSVNGSPVVVSSQTGSFIVNTGSFATTGSNSFLGNQTITGSLLISSSATNDLIVSGNMVIGGLAFPTITLSGSTGVGQTSIGAGAISYISGSPAAGTTTGMTAVVGKQISSFYIPTGGFIGLSGNPAQTGPASLASVTVPSIYAQSTGSAQYYPVITLQPSASYTDGRVTLPRNVAMLQNLEITGSLTASLAQGYVWVGDVNNKTTLVATSSFGGFVSGSVPEGTVSSSAQILNYGIFATTGSNTFNGTQTISGSLLTNGGAIFGNNTSQYNSLTVSSSLATYPGNVFNSIGIDTDGGGQWSAGMYVSTYSSFGSQPQFGLYGGGNGNNGDNNILNSYGNLVRINKNTQITGSLTLTGSLTTNGGATFGNNQAQYNNLELKTSNTTYPGNLYNTIYINADNNGQYSAGVGVSTYTELGSNPVAFLFGGGDGNKVDGGNTALKLANGDIYIQKDTNLTGSLTIQGPTSITTNTNTALAINANTSVAIAVQSGSIETNGSIFFNNPPFYPGTSNNRAQFAMTGVSEFQQKFGDTNQSGSSVTWQHNTGSLKSSVDLVAKYNGVEGGITVQNLNGSSSVIINVNDSAEIKGNIKFERGTNKASGIVSVGSSGATVTNSLVSTNSIILLTTQNSGVAGNEYPAVVSSKSAGSFDIAHGYGGNLDVGYLIINPAP